MKYVQMSEGYSLPPSRITHQTSLVAEEDHHKQLVAVVVEEVTSTDILNYLNLTISYLKKI